MNARMMVIPTFALLLAADTPEAATLILIGTGLAFIARYRRFGSLPPTA